VSPVAAFGIGALFVIAVALLAWGAATLIDLSARVSELEGKK
jgi:hypothetical protein